MGATGGHKDDPLYKIRRLLRAAAITARTANGTAAARPDAGDPTGDNPRHCYLRLRAIYHAPGPATGPELGERLLDMPTGNR